MKHLTAFFKKLRLRQILTVFLAGALLIVTSACNNGDSLGARPQNPPVQMGGNNNPHSNGGDGYTNYKMSTDPNVSKTANPRDRADLQILSNQLIATSDSEILYPGAETPAGRAAKEKELPIKTSEDFEVSGAGGRQPIINRSDPNAKILESIGEEFKEASSFIKDKSDEAGQRPEMQSNPALHK
ncbi:hypothetical protein H6F78_19100 [Coleofasciculus sp. FACHB-64]|uniref:DUF6658 family protein n=1 Tax=Cyanophyceae TaxID=3028117 RepID=UPI0016881BA9|nr:hypothetical protein [Coleofasciculus sp. FACHB-501]MBD1881310.1 hypothetical protein [Coleofasciculus sp. FACHB-T130]MBD1892190.1 hypothetical protein [Coleofasciculus sp. FACHB-SPT9]MBD1893385.1 hypothetical protein [Coleofasciculus sp. FACHB-129]MBD1902663.1 hypothetical protein [Coleofasciculus sp. FACHB-125]MBD1944892.1 hypothetical protein [Coleofasciculus sp. FACHB-712]MBD2047669.1 hypothetical protein [Coleofasciculus sp. FACHB-64]MBD2084072.1 hypothetical protein [Coleofasciculus